MAFQFRRSSKYIFKMLPCCISAWNDFIYFLSENHPVNWPFGSREVQNIFSRCGSFWLSDWCIFDIQVAPIFPIKFWVNWPFSSGEAQNRFSQKWPWWPSGLSNPNNFSYFLSNSCTNTSYQVLSQLAFQFKRKVQNRFSRWQQSWISHWNDFNYFFYIYKLPWYFLRVNWPRGVWGGVI